MCAHALAIVSNIIGNKLYYLDIKEVFFGCYNDRFGGNGSILSLH